jgi:DNA-directed RNA polymerase II subunit RPB2
LGRKRIDLAGELLMNLFSFEFKKKYLGHAALTVRRVLQEQQVDLNKKIGLIFDSRIITRSMQHSMSTGNWLRGPLGANLTGISQSLRRDTNYLSTLSHLRKISAPFFSESRDTVQRLLHNTHFGMYCPAESP